MTWRGQHPSAYAKRGGNQSQGYYTGSPVSYGQGSGMGQAMAGTGTLAQGVTVAGQTWHPTVLYLGALVLFEMVVFAFIGKLLS